jgi:hypothetical protein
MSFSDVLRKSPGAVYTCQGQLVASVGGMHKAHRAGDEDKSKLTNQTLRHVAWFVSECIKVRETMPDLSRHF